MLALTLDAAPQAVRMTTTLLLALDFVWSEVLVLAFLFMNQKAGWRRLLFLFRSVTLNLFLVLAFTTFKVQVSQQHVSEVIILLALIGNNSQVVMNCILDHDTFLATFSYIHWLTNLVLLLFKEHGAVDLRPQRDFVSAYYDFLSYNFCLFGRNGYLLWLRSFLFLLASDRPWYWLWLWLWLQVLRVWLTFRLWLFVAGFLLFTFFITYTTTL